MKCRKCKKELIEHWYTWNGNGYLYYTTEDESWSRPGWFYPGVYGRPCIHEPETETDRMKRLIREYDSMPEYVPYGTPKPKPEVPQRKNPFINKEKPWKKR